MFANIPGALETPFQAAPLDLCEDTFYYARKDLIEARLVEIRDGMGPEILQRHDEQYREKETWCVGLSWELCEREDLLDIVRVCTFLYLVPMWGGLTYVQCLGANSLSTICKLFCEDYKGRRSGGPDLFIWKAEQQLCKFVEVKGPGDTPQENQKLWFDALLRANAAVEICKVVDIATDNNSIKGKKRKAKTPASSRSKKHAQLLESNSEEEDYDHLDREHKSDPRSGKRRRLRKHEDMVDVHQPTPSSPSIPRMKGYIDR
jgi:fanconi-associated nuclease 1